jgi:Common central domain of tyrosinase
MAKKIAKAARSQTRPAMSTKQHRMLVNPDLETFAGHLSMIPRGLREILKLPPWLSFLFPYERKDQAKLTTTETSRFLCAFDTLNANGTLGQFVEVHGQPVHRMHHTLRFLPWHRVFLVRFERALQAIHPDVSIPYWEWTNPAEQSFPSWLSAVLPTVVTPSRTITVIRAPGSNADLATIASNTPTAHRGGDCAQRDAVSRIEDRLPPVKGC